MKKIIFICILVLFVFIIYIINIDKKEFVFLVGDSLSLSKNSYGITNYDGYLNDYLKKRNISEKYIIYGKEEYRIGELERDIKSNIIVNDRHIQNILIKADLVIIEIGIDNLVPILFSNDKDYIYDYLDGIIVNMESLIKIIKSYCKEKILLVGYYNPYLNNNNIKYIDYVNEKYKSISNKYQINYLDLSDLNKEEYFSNPSNYYLNNKGYKKLNDKIIDLIYKN